MDWKGGRRNRGGGQFPVPGPPKCYCLLLLFAKGSADARTVIKIPGNCPDGFPENNPNHSDAKGLPGDRPNYISLTEETSHPTRSKELYTSNKIQQRINVSSTRCKAMGRVGRYSKNLGLCPALKPPRTNSI